MIQLDVENSIEHMHPTCLIGELSVPTSSCSSALALAHKEREGKMEIAVRTSLLETSTLVFTSTFGCLF